MRFENARKTLSEGPTPTENYKQLRKFTAMGSLCGIAYCSADQSPPHEAKLSLDTVVQHFILYLEHRNICIFSNINSQPEFRPAPRAHKSRLLCSFSPVHTIPKQAITTFSFHHTAARSLLCLSFLLFCYIPLCLWGFSVCSGIRMEVGGRGGN